MEAVAAKKARLDALRPLSEEAVARLDAWYDVELTYTSNALEGNTLTRSETAVVLEKGITVRGKPLKDHVEATDHREALVFMRALAKDPRPLGEGDVRDLHRLVTAGTLREESGRYATASRRVLGSETEFPPASDIPALMAAFGSWLSHAGPAADTAFDAHVRLVRIHPFIDGNGRTARLLMNLILLRAGYPPMTIRPDDRPDYLDALEAWDKGDRSPYDALMLARLDAALDDWLRFLEEGT